MKNKTTWTNGFRRGLSLLVLTTTFSVSAAPTKVGNGDDGTDLEGAVLIQSGPIWEARLRAVEMLESLHVSGIAGLGILIPEVAKTQLMMARRDVTPFAHEFGAEISKDGRMVYAKTFAEPHAATRFFPAAEKLGVDELVALHIHEALHRSLPETIRENEEAVGEITLALTAPGAHYDRVQKVVAQWTARGPLPTASESIRTQVSGTNAIVKSQTRDEKDEVSYTYESFNNGKLAAGNYAQLHILGGKKHLLSQTRWSPWLGFQMATDASSNRPGTRQNVALGPIEASLGVRLMETQDHEMELKLANAFASGNFRGYERDVFTLALISRTESSSSVVESSFSYSPGSQAKTAFDDRRSYESIWTVSAKAGYKVSSFVLAGQLALHNSDGWQGRQHILYPTDDAFHTGRFKLLTGGPELSWKYKKSLLTFFWKEVFAGPKNRDFNDLGDPLGRGDGARSLGTSFSYEL